MTFIPCYWWSTIFEAALRDVYIEKVRNSTLKEIVKTVSFHNLGKENEVNFIKDVEETIEEFCISVFKNTWNDSSIESNKEMMKDELSNMFYIELKSVFMREFNRTMKTYKRQVKQSHFRRYGRYLATRQRSIPTLLKKLGNNLK